MGMTGRTSFALSPRATLQCLPATPVHLSFFKLLRIIWITITSVNANNPRPISSGYSMPSKHEKERHPCRSPPNHPWRTRGELPRALWDRLHSTTPSRCVASKHRSNITSQALKSDKLSRRCVDQGYDFRYCVDPARAMHLHTLQSTNSHFSQPCQGAQRENGLLGVLFVTINTTVVYTRPKKGSTSFRSEASRNARPYSRMTAQ
ncbi:hypothetical protein F5I97DRAFT_1060328 [Phlebopus sp. FC_14]|nr:hypothetical protein F5I97DRAFT_1060328 [Phlebopus sp. FC_14]